MTHSSARPAAGFFQRDWKCRTRRFPVETAADRLALAGLDFRAAVSMALSAGKLEVLGGKGRSGPAPGQPGWPEVEDAPSARVSGVQDLVSSLDGLCQRLSQELSHRVSVNLYVSPPQSRGLDRHQDGHADVPNETRVEPLPALVPELRLRRSGPVSIVYRSDSVGLCRPSQTGTDVWFPMAFAKALRFVATVEPPKFTVRAVPGVSAPSRARLCQLLLEQGYVQLLAS